MPWKPLGIELTQNQKLAVNHDKGPILVVAGAGTGKTLVLASRIARLIEERVAEPSEILAVTYTRNSARDLLKRVARSWKGNDDAATLAAVGRTGLKAGTFHSYCYWLLREAGQEFELLEDKDLYVLLRRRIEDLHLEYYTRAANVGQFLEGLIAFFQRCHDELRTPDDYDAYVTKLERKEIPLPRVSQSKHAAAMTDEEVLGRCREIARVYRHVEDMLHAGNLGTYSHLITRAVGLLRDSKNSGQLKQARRGARFLLVDEFQDSNVAQIELTRLLAGEEANVFAVGDPDQAIYRFRGASTGTFDHFLRVFGVARVKRVGMPENRRSTEPVLKAAYSAISHNKDIASVELHGGERWKREPLQHKRTTREPDPIPAVQLKGWVSTVAEAAFIADEIERLHREDKRTWKDFAVLYHDHAHRNEVVEELTRRGVPFAVTGLDLLETPEVRDLLAALHAMEGDDAVSLLRVAALPRFGIDGTELRGVLAAAGENASVNDALQRVAGGSDVLAALLEARNDLKRAQNSATVACEVALRRFGIESTGDTKGLEQFVKKWSEKPRQVKGEDTLTEFLKYLEYFAEARGRITAPEENGEDSAANLQMEMGQRAAARNDNAVRLLTVHAAKGLEFPVVFVLRLTSPSFPGRFHEDLVEFPNALRDRGSCDDDNPKHVHKEEQRRLFYVAMTRAEDALYLCAKQGRGKDPVSPGYLRELVNAGKKDGAGCVEFTLVPDIVERQTERPAATLMSRIAQWVELPPLAQTLSHKLSARAIESYEACPLRYKLSMDWNLPEEPTANIHYGSAMHNALLAHFDALRKGRPLTVDDVVRCFLDEFGDKPIADVTQRKLYEMEGSRKLRAFLASLAAQPRGKVALLEHWFNCTVGETRVTGRIDRVDEDADGYVIVDYKTGKPKSQDTADESVQLSVYALAMSSRKPVKMLVFENLEDNSTVVTQRSAEDLREMEVRIADVAAGIAAGKFDANPEYHCKWCAYRGICPAMEVRLPDTRAGENQNE